MVSYMQIYVPPHPLIQHWLAIARNGMSPPPIFRAAIAELGRILVYEAGRDWLPTMEQQISSPVGVADATFVDPTQPVKVRNFLCCRSGATCLTPAYIVQTRFVLEASELCPSAYTESSCKQPPQLAFDLADADSSKMPPIILAYFDQVLCHRQSSHPARHKILQANV